MKNSKIFLFLLMMCLSLSMSAQNLRFSFLANPQIVWLQGDQAGFETNGSLLRLNTGIEMDFFFAENYAFSTGLTINSLGGGVIYDDTISLETANGEEILPMGTRLDHSIQYLAVPVGLKFKTVEIGYTTFWLNTGVNTMFRIKSRGTDEGMILEKADLKEEIGVLNLNYFIEGGLEYSIGGSTALIGGIGFHSGLMDVTDRPTDKITTQGVSLIIGILF